MGGILLSSLVVVPQPTGYIITSCSSIVLPPFLLHICRYLQKAGGVWSDIVCDGYCHRKLMFHVAAAGRGDVLGELLTDLRWVAACCRCWDANSLLASYTTFKDVVPQEVCVCSCFYGNSCTLVAMVTVYLLIEVSPCLVLFLEFVVSFCILILILSMFASPALVCSGAVSDVH